MSRTLKLSSHTTLDLLSETKSRPRYSLADITLPVPPAIGIPSQPWAYLYLTWSTLACVTAPAGYQILICGAETSLRRAQPGAQEPR